MKYFLNLRGLTALFKRLIPLLLRCYSEIVVHYYSKIKNSLLIRFQNLPLKYLFLGGVVLIMAVYIVIFREQTLVYNYGGATCDKRLLLLPELFSQPEGEAYTVTATGGVAVLGQRLTATSVCFSPKEAPGEDSIESVTFSPLGSWIGRLTYHIHSKAPPVLNTEILKVPFPVTRSLHIPLSGPDTTFSYRISADSKQADCTPADKNVVCDVPSLGLKQGSEYDIAIEKYFREQKIMETAVENVKTLSPLTLVSSSVEYGKTVYYKPDALVLEFDKQLQRVEMNAAQKDDSSSIIPSTSEINDKRVTIRFTEDLPREVELEVTANALEATDGSTTLDPLSIRFEMSGGPKVVGVNAGSFGVGIGSEIIVSFDQELSLEQDISPLFSVSGGLQLTAKRGNQLVFSTASAGICQTISVSIKPGIISPYGIAGTGDWRYDGRTGCYTTTIIGYSVRGRPIYAHSFGSGSESILYTGAIHGSEASTKHLMDKWIQELDANPNLVPSNKRVIVIPSINPDGFATGQRVNANNIDLNRNFATSDWKKDVEHTNGSFFAGGGGQEPMSEPETRAIAAFVAQQRPALVISYHSIGSLVISNQSGQANSKAAAYASASGYTYSLGGSGEFGYQVTGTADDYYREILGVPSILVELGSHSYHQFERNKAAMWAMM